MPRQRRPGLEVVPIPGRTALYLRGSIAGRRIFESTGTDRPELAEEKRAAREAELYRAAVHGAPAARHSFSEAVLGYQRDRRPGEGTKNRLHKLLRHFGPRLMVDEIDQARIDRAAEAILRPGYAPATKLREIVTPVRSVLTWAAARKWCGLPVFEKGAAGKSRTEWLSPAEVDAQIAAAERHLKPLLTFLYATGARLGEALDLLWDDVDLQHARAVLRDTKNGRDRLVNLPPRAVAALAGLPHRADQVFRQRRGKVYADRERLSGGQIRSGWAGSLKRAGIARPLTPHHARHTWASWHYAMHRDLLLLKRDGDWSSVTLVERYAHLVPEGMVQTIRAWFGVQGRITPADTETHRIDIAKVS